MTYVIVLIPFNIFFISRNKKTCKALKQRITQHLNHIEKFIPFKKYHDKVVARHFRMNNHGLYDFKVCVFKIEENTNVRQEKELDLINFLNLKVERCINEKTSNFTKSFIFN